LNLLHFNIKTKNCLVDKKFAGLPFVIVKCRCCFSVL